MVLYWAKIKFHFSFTLRPSSFFTFFALPSFTFIKISLSPIIIGCPAGVVFEGVAVGRPNQGYIDFETGFCPKPRHHLASDLRDWVHKTWALPNTLPRASWNVQCRTIERSLVFLQLDCKCNCVLPVHGKASTKAGKGCPVLPRDAKKAWSMLRALAFVGVGFFWCTVPVVLFYLFPELSEKTKTLIEYSCLWTALTTFFVAAGTLFKVGQITGTQL